MTTQDSFGVVDIPGVRSLLEARGVRRVGYCHYRNKEGQMETFATLWNGSADAWLARGKATCDPRDQFSRKAGRTIALRRAIHNLDLKGRRG